MNAAFLSDGGPPWWFLLFGGGPILLLAAAWLFMAAILVFRGNGVDKPNRMAQFYGYSVCLISLIAALASTMSLIDAAFDRANPLQTEGGFGVSLVSFEAYQATSRRELAMFDRSGTARPDTVSEATQRLQYEAMVRDRLATTRYRTSKTFVTSTLLLLMAGALFWFHWRWVRRLDEKAAA